MTNPIDKQICGDCVNGQEWSGWMSQTSTKRRGLCTLEGGPTPPDGIDLTKSPEENYTTGTNRVEQEAWQQLKSRGKTCFRPRTPPTTS